MELLNKDGEFPTSKYLEWGYGSIGSYCAWNSMTDLLATASKNTKARIWDINAGVPRSSTILNHALTIDGTLLEKPVSSVDWNFDGTLLATGSMDGFTRIWTTYGRLIRIFGHTSKTIFYVRWNKRSNYILTAGPDITTSVWEAETGHCIQEFSFHSASVSCVEWMDNITFASGSADKCIYVCKLGMKYNTPFKQFYGHTGEVNSIKWDPEGKLLASCSEDTTLKIWSMTEDVVLNLYGHDKGVCRLAWSPTGPGSPNPNKNRMLASISNDSRIRLWDIHQNTCFHILFVQTDEICSVEFSPDGKLLAAASSKTLQIWSTQDWQIVFNFEADSNFCFISWNLRGYLLAATSLNGNVFVLDTRTLSLVKDSTLSTN